MGIVETIAAEVIKRVLNRTGVRPVVNAWNPERLRPHLIEVVNWSRRIEFIGLAEARDTDRDTVALFASLPRKFRGKQAAVATTNEDDLVSAAGNIILLGDPGAGKTTTLKRIARAVLDAPASAEDTAEYPVVVRLREISDEILLEEALGRALGIPTKRKARADSQRGRRRSRTIQYGAVQVVSGKYAALDVIAEIANDSDALFLIDGLDEVL